MKIDVEKAGRYGLDPVTVSTGLAIAIKGGQASTLRVPGEGGYLIRVRYPENERRSIKDLMCIYVSTKSGTAPLRGTGIPG